jgi:transcriptional regulator with XRE-family HTH domain
MTFGEKIKKLRIDKGLTQDELAEKIFVTRTAVSKWESDRGYPNIDSLKALAGFFSVTVDDLLSSNEVLTIAEEDNKRKEKRFLDMIYGLLDLCMSMLLFLPFFAEKAGADIQSVSLIELDGIQIYVKIAYLFIVGGIIAMGVLTLALQSCQAVAWQRIRTSISLMLGVSSVLLFMISSQPYAAIFAFALLSIKAFLLIKRA